MKIAVDSAIPYIKGVLEPWGKVRYCDAIGRADAMWADALIVRTRTRCDEALLEGTPVQLVASATAGFDHIDTEYCFKAGIETVWAPGCNARGVLQWVAAALAHCLPEGARGRLGDGAAGGSRVDGMSGYGVDTCRDRSGEGASGSNGVRRLTVGVVGVGAVGSLVAEYAAHWGFDVMLCDPPLARVIPGEVEGYITALEPFSKQMAEHATTLGGVRLPQHTHDQSSQHTTCGALRSKFHSPEEISTLRPQFHSLDEIAAQADIITFHTPLTCTGEDATFHMADAAFFARLKPNALIFNASRGEVIDTEALLNSGLSCCIDTWEGEPNIVGNAFSRELLEKTVLATPHIAGYTVQGKANATAAAVRAVARHFDLQPKNVAMSQPSVGEAAPDGLPSVDAEAPDCMPDLGVMVDLRNWYPAGITPPSPRLIEWGEMCATMPQYFDIVAETNLLKGALGSMSRESPIVFERRRDNYPYREEFF